MLLGVTPADITLAPLNAARTLHPSRRSGFGTWALAARLSGMAVRRTNNIFQLVMLPMKLRVSGPSTLGSRLPQRASLAHRSDRPPGRSWPEFYGSIR